LKGEAKCGSVETARQWITSSHCGGDWKADRCRYSRKKAEYRWFEVISSSTLLIDFFTRLPAAFCEELLLLVNRSLQRYEDVSQLDETGISLHIYKSRPDLQNYFSS
jgi:hypothetical protein